MPISLRTQEQKPHCHMFVKLALYKTLQKILRAIHLGKCQTLGKATPGMNSPDPPFCR